MKIFFSFINISNLDDDIKVEKHSLMYYIKKSILQFFSRIIKASDVGTDGKIHHYTNNEETESLMTDLVTIFNYAVFNNNKNCIYLMQFL